MKNEMTIIEKAFKQWRSGILIVSMLALVISTIDKIWISSFQLSLIEWYGSISLITSLLAGGLLYSSYKAEKSE